jgi:Holliday junction resolvasome RuvABC endonuclease subunit
VSRRTCGATVLGLDLSLTSPGMCVIPCGWELGDWGGLHCFTWVPEIFGQTERDRISRIVGIADFVFAYALQHHAEHVFVEQYAFSRSSSSVTKLAELGGAVRAKFYWEAQIVLQPVVASQARKLVLGKLPAKDAKKLTHMALASAGAGFENGDVADAFVVANFGLSELGLTALTLA